MKGVRFPPDESDSAIFGDFLCKMTDKSELQASWARSNLLQYNRYINNFLQFCHERGVRFPPDEPDCHTCGLFV